MREFIVSESKLRAESVSALSPYTMWHECNIYFDRVPGSEHYRLLAHLSNQLVDGETVLDVGTYVGFSALAMSANNRAKVVTYDIHDCFPSDSTLTAKHRQNIEFRIGNIIDDMPDLLNCPFILLDTAHEGGFERSFINQLLRLGYKGIVLCDDINLNNPMRSFWADMPVTKLNMTALGHSTGTGALIFDPSTVNIRIVP